MRSAMSERRPTDTQFQATARAARRWLAALASALGLVMAATAGAADKVEQPIEFPHDIHAGKMGINCMYCHTYARRSKVSGIPPLRKCIGCHQSLPSVRDKPRIKKLFEYWDKGEALPFKKVHDLPDFVRFNHELHIQRFYFQEELPVQQVCGFCHGDVANMTVAEKMKPLTMGWCISCHEQDHPATKGSSETVNGPNDCFTCHK
jgi:hypothetical protein